jgi:cyclic pyranopterin phosphate synthase
METNFSYDKPLPGPDTDQKRSSQTTIEGDEAAAEGHVVMNEAAFQAFITAVDGGMSEAWTVARLAGIMGAKQADELILVSHSCNIAGIEMSFKTDEESNKVTIRCEVRTRERIGAATAAMVGCGLALMGLVNSMRAIDKEMSIEGLHLLKK